MWVLKFRNWHKNCLIRPRCIKYNVTDFVHLINSYIEKNKFCYTELHILQGAKEAIKKFSRDLRKEVSIKKFEQVGNHIITLNIEPLEKQYYSPVFDTSIIYIKPVAQRTDGYEDWELACWDREVLMKITDIKDFDVKINSIKQTKLSDIFMPSVYPRFSTKQKEAIELAVKNGYYHFPRRIYLEKLASLAKVKRQTYQENLRKAEEKLIPFLTENIS